MTLSFALLSLLPLLPAALAQSAGVFNVLTYNVAGLPALFNGNDIPGDKTVNTARIGQLFTQYNISIINVQEDFNFHATLYENDKHPYRTPTSGGVPLGSGLNTLSNYPYTAFQRVKWDTCSTFDSADCLTPKGFTFTRVQLASGVFVDTFNLHADAGSTAADRVARASNLRQVSDFIKANSAGNAVVVFGDSNSRYTRGPDDIPEVFAQQNGMKDVWLELVRNNVAPAPGAPALVCSNPSTTNACEIVDKVWYRGSSAISLQATSFDYAGDMFLQADGNILSDHNGVLVDFAWRRNANVKVSDTFGGEEGSWFNDVESVASVSSPIVSTITVQGTNRVDAVSLKLASGQTYSHGGTGGAAQTLALNAGEKLVSATICRGDKDSKTRIFYLELRTSTGRKVSNGVKTGDCVDRNAESGFAITGFLGRAGNEVDMLGFVYSKV